MNGSTGLRGEVEFISSLNSIDALTVMGVLESI